MGATAVLEWMGPRYPIFPALPAERHAGVSMRHGLPNSFEELLLDIERPVLQTATPRNRSSSRKSGCANFEPRRGLR